MQVHEEQTGNSEVVTGDSRFGTLFSERSDAFLSFFSSFQPPLVVSPHLHLPCVIYLHKLYGRAFRHPLSFRHFPGEAVCENANDAALYNAAGDCPGHAGSQQQGNSRNIGSDSENL